MKIKKIHMFLFFTIVTIVIILNMYAQIGNGDSFFMPENGKIVVYSTIITFETFIEGVGASLLCLVTISVWIFLPENKYKKRKSYGRF